MKLFLSLLMIALSALVALAGAAGAFTHAADCHCEEECDGGCDCDLCQTELPPMVLTNLNYTSHIAQASWHAQSCSGCHEQLWLDDIEHPPQILI